MIIKKNNKKYDLWVNSYTMMKEKIPSDNISNIINKRKTTKAYKEFEDLCEVHSLDSDIEREELKQGYFSFLKEASLVKKEERKEIPKPKTTFQEVLTEAEHEYEVEVISCIMAQNKQERNPAWLSIIAPPSSGKSFDLKICSNEKYAQPIDSISDNALAAMRPNKDVEQSNDVFSNAEDMCLVNNDMGSMFGDNDDKVSKYIGFLTAAFGGDFDRAGPVEVRHYNTKMAIIIGMTDKIYRKNIKKMSSFGNRFLTLKYVDEDPRVFDDDDFIDSDLPEKIQNHISYALTQEWKIPFAENLKYIMKDFIKKIVIIRSFFYARTKYDLERPHRLFNQIKNLMRSRARLHGRKIVNMEDFEFTKRLIWLSIPYLQFIYNVGTEGVITHLYNRTYRNFINNGKKLGIVKMEYVSDIEDVLQPTYFFTSYYKEITDKIVDFLTEIEYKFEIYEDMMIDKKK